MVFKPNWGGFNFNWGGRTCPSCPCYRTPMYSCTKVLKISARIHCHVLIKTFYLCSTTAQNWDVQISSHGVREHLLADHQQINRAVLLVCVFSVCECFCVSVSVCVCVCVCFSMCLCVCGLVPIPLPVALQLVSSIRMSYNACELCIAFARCAIHFYSSDNTKE